MGRAWDGVDHTEEWLARRANPLGYVVDENGCWIWQRSCNNKGYGLRWNPQRRRLETAHRWHYEQAKGPIPPGLEIDHLCKVRSCVNPEHLEAVTRQEHHRRTHARRPRPDKLREPLPVRQVDPTDCILWDGHLDRDGYGQKFPESKGGKIYMAHRWAYEQAYGPVPSWMHIDHLCRVRACVNPEHLEPVTPLENALRRPIKRQEACKYGHAYTPENTLWQKDGTRKCRTCRLATIARSAQQKRERRQADPT